jgi:hypothetical protein
MITHLVITYIMSLGLVLHAFVLGAATLKLLKLNPDKEKLGQNNYLLCSFALAVGLAFHIVLLMVLGFASFLNEIAVGLLGVVTFTGGIIYLGGAALKNWNFTYSDLILFFVLLLVTLSFAWHAPGHWDDTSFHLPLARFYLENNAVELQEYLRFPLFPQNMNMLMVLGLMLGDTLTAQMFSTLPWFVICIGLMGASKWFMNSHLLGIFVALVLAKLVVPFKVGFGYAYVDAGLAMFCWIALIALLCWYTDDKNPKGRHLGWLILSGVLAGAAAGTKLFGGVFAFLLFTFIVIFSRSIKSAIFFGLTVLTFGSWWYVRSFFISGDPFHPVGAEVFGYFLWNKDDLSGQVAEQAIHGVERNIWYLWGALKAAGVQLWALSFVGLFLPNMPRYIRILQCIFVVYFLFWFFVTQVDRYLAPIVVVGTFLSLYTLYMLFVFLYERFKSLENIFHNPRFYFMASIILCLSLSVMGIRKGIDRWDAALQQYSGYSLFVQASTLREKHGTKLVQMGFENAAYFFEGIAIGDWFGVARYSQMLDCATGSCQPIGADAMQELLKKFDSEILIVSTNRYPMFNPKNYESHFDIVSVNHQGVLMTLK